jgi:hypothetical protein
VVAASRRVRQRDGLSFKVGRRPGTCPRASRSRTVSVPAGMLAAPVGFSGIRQMSETLARGTHHFLTELTRCSRTFGATVQYQD